MFDCETISVMVGANLCKGSRQAPRRRTSPSRMQRREFMRPDTNCSCRNPGRIPRGLGRRARRFLERRAHPRCAIQPIRLMPIAELGRRRYFAFPSLGQTSKDTLVLWFHFVEYSSRKWVWRLVMGISSPAMKTRLTSVFMSSGSPFATTMFAVLPTSSEPS